MITFHAVPDPPALTWSLPDSSGDFPMKILFALLASAGLCSCALVPDADDSYDADQYVSPSARTATYPGLTNPRTYMDKDDPNIQRLISSRMF
jgi:hypothetical protein